MLVQFTLKNFRSFKQESTLDMSAIGAYKEHRYNLINNGAKEKFVKVAAIYGANASGKSNLTQGMLYFRRIIAKSMNNVDDDALPAISKYYCPFSFDNDGGNTEFQVVELLGDYEYTYGFEYNDKSIVSEWLYRKNQETNRTTTVFERDGKEIVFGASVRKRCDLYKGQVPQETLVLSFFKRLKLETDIFNTVYSGIMDTLVSDADKLVNKEIFNKILPEFIRSDKMNLLSFLHAIDTGIKDIDYDDTNKDINFYTTHIDQEGNRHSINLLDESKGTIKSIVIYLYARVAMDTDRSLFIDELNSRLHPLLLKFIVDLFYTKKSKAQLIYTTHDTTLLDKKFFRRDQIWFVQKDEFGHSQLVALSDYKVRTDASFEKDYLAGVYGGIPLIGEFEVKEEEVKGGE